MAEPARVLTIYDRPLLTAPGPAGINDKMTFGLAAPRWLESRRAYISERTYRDYGYYIGRLNDFFAGIVLENIDGDHLREYQKIRSAHVQGQVINHEIGVVVQMLKRISRWPVAGGYEVLPLPRESPGRCIESWEENRYFRMAASNPAWEVAHLATMLMRHTGICPGELRRVRLKDVDAVRRVVRIAFGKNVNRERFVPLEGQAWEAMAKLLKRADKLGSTAPDHHLLPYRLNTGSYEPTRPASETFMRTAHREICAAAGVRMRAYDWRHTAATLLLENPNTPTETAVAILGHVSPRMLRHTYNHARLETMRKAMESLDRDPKTKRPGKKSTGEAGRPSNLATTGDVA